MAANVYNLGRSFHKQIPLPLSVDRKTKPPFITHYKHTLGISLSP